MPIGKAVTMGVTLNEAQPTESIDQFGGTVANSPLKITWDSSWGLIKERCLHGFHWLKV